MDDMTADRLLRRFTQLEAQRQPLIAHWRDVFDHMAPERSSGWYDSNFMGVADTASAQRATLQDSTAIDGMEVLKSNISSGMTPENSRWFALDAGEDDEDATRWMDGAADALFAWINAAGFSATANECYSDLLPAGWFVLYIDEARDPRGQVIGGYNFETWPLHQCYVSSSRAGGRVDIITRRWFPTVEQVVSEYGLDKVSERVRTLYLDGKYADTIELLWCIEPQTVGRTGILARNKPFSSTHMEKSGKHILRKSGYDEFPCAVPRWRLVPGTSYATGIGSNVLPDTKTLNQIIRDELMSLRIAVGGMWKATDDGVLNPRTVKIGPLKVVMVADINNFVPLQTGANFNVGFSKQETLQGNIRRALLSDMLSPVGGPVRSATEVAQRVNQIRSLLAPILGRLQQEYLQVVIERCFNIAYRSGALVAKLGPLPDSLAGGGFEVRYISPLARSQKQEEVTAIDAHLMGLLEIAKATGDATVLDGVKLDPAMYEKALALGMPADLLRGPKELAQKRQMDLQNQQAAQQAQQQQELQTAAATASIDVAAKSAAA